LFSFLSHFSVSPNPNPLHYDEEEAPTAPHSLLQYRTTKPPDQRHSTTAYTTSIHPRPEQWIHRLAAIHLKKGTAEANQVPGGIHLQLHWRRPIHQTSPIVYPWKIGAHTANQDPGGIHLQLHWRRPIHRTSPIVDPWKIGAHTVASIVR
jgi:hypothetical protein